MSVYSTCVRVSQSDAAVVCCTAPRERVGKIFAKRGKGDAEVGFERNSMQDFNNEIVLLV